MDWGGPGFIVAIIALSTVGWLVNNWIRARHGYSLEDEWGGKTDRADSAATQRLESRIGDLSRQIADQGDRVRVLEKIVTDKGYNVAQEIEALRDTRRIDEETGSGVPLHMDKREHA